ncbi:solute carrier family 22 member 5-like isoform X2 [Ostrinia furnacalis]|uniref:solute carrier family 22 member 5-like isoform X2 n=1 Tax=Ostrinia furnacalis TaxID=93504 RepID=UPI00103FA957|nr:solute carrier family 22 member 5-like isoform X2 [Ostrinia furnacalis]
MASAENGDFPDKQRIQVEPKMRSINLDKVLEDEVGAFGWFQKRVILLAGLLVVFVSWSNNEYVFTTARIPTRCHIPECDLEEPEFHSEWLPSAIPGSAAALDGCQRFGAANASAARADACPPDWFDRDRLESCERHLYENTDTVVYDFDLACDEWRRALIGSMKVFGMLLGVPLTGYVSDRFGRRTAAVITAVNCAWIGILRFFANTYIGFIISVFAETAFGSAYTTVFILMMEIVGPKFRVGVGATMTSFFSIGQMIMALIAWGVPNWKHLTLALFAPQFITIAYFWLLPESFRWYMSRGRYEESQNVLKKIAKVNKKTLSEKSLIALKQFGEEEKARQEKLKEQSKNEPWLIVLVFRHKPILIRCLVSPIWWITTTFIYYGLTINAVNMSGNRFVNYIAVMAAQIPGYWSAVFLIEKIGRKPALITAFWLCAACQIGYIIMPEGQYALSLTLYLAGTYCISNVVTAVYSYTAELYPTKYRNSLFAFSSTMGRIGSILAPLTPALGAAVWDKLPFALFAGLACLSGALVFVTPETRGTKFPDTMEEASQLGRNNKRTSTRL